MNYVETINHKQYQKRIRSLTLESLCYTIADAKEAIKANPQGLKAGYYADEVNYCANEIARRRKVGA